MITKKDWNNLPVTVRKKAVKLIFFNMPESFQDEMSEKWNHDIDVWHKALFNNMYWDKDKKHIKVTISLNVV